MGFRDYSDGLKPFYRFLSDKAVIVQAWKKAHEYIRRHNWYSDNFDLDLSCINLEELYIDIQRHFIGRKASSYKPSPMRMIPAPKCCDKWNLHNGEYRAPSDFETRPLAHLEIKDQVVSMMFLMCLANIIERRQGVPRSTKELTRLTDVVSYGNRLISDAVVDSARESEPPSDDRESSFLWGNSETYSRYYADYQNFVERPLSILKRLRKNHSRGERRFLIATLDLSKFYDRINRKVLVDKVRDEVEAVRMFDNEFVSAFEKSINWTWDSRDYKLTSAYQRKIDGLDSGNQDWIEGRVGIPQGLAAGGFFANIYLLSFDDYLRRLIDDGGIVEINGAIIRVHDYCRYVDDMRIVVSTDRNVEIDDNLRNAFVDMLGEKLAELSPGQRFSKSKTKWEEPVEDQETDFVSYRMKESKWRASGPLDERSACELVELNRALWTESTYESGEELREESPFRTFFTRQNSSIKTDRIERFAANNWRRAYRALLGMLPLEDANRWQQSGTLSRKILNRMTDEFCEEVFLRWLKDPSKVRILRIALDLRPQVKFLKPLVQVLIGMLKADSLSKACASYVLAELFRAAAVETGYVVNDDSHLKEEVSLYREFLHDQIDTFQDLDIPWYTANQIILFELVFKKVNARIPSRILEASDQSYQECYALIVDRKSNKEHIASQLDVIILAYLLSKDEKILARNHAEIAMAAMTSEVSRHKCIAFLPHNLIDEIRPVSFIANELLPDEKTCLGNDNSITTVNQYKSLREITFSDTNIFVNEVAIIRLGLALCEFFKDKQISNKHFYSLEDLEIYCANWDSLSEAAAIDCRLLIRARRASVDRSRSDFMFKPEPWENPSFAKMAQVGRILRAVAMSGDEYSAMRREALSIPAHAKDADVDSRFYGVRSVWLKRRYGLYFDRVCLGGVHVAFSPWFSELLSALLAWPGSCVSTQYRKLTWSGLIVVLRDRLSDLARFAVVPPDTLLIPVDVDR